MESLLNLGIDLSLNGFNLQGLLLFINRLVVGLFFAISGYHKLFLKQRHEQLVSTLEEDKIPMVPFFQWFVPFVEFAGGIAIVLGVFAPLAALAIMILLTVAILTDGIKRIPGFQPVDKADALDDFLYLPEATYWFMALFVVLGGPGWFSLHELV